MTRHLSRAGAGATLVACGFAGLLAVTGCGGSSSPSASPSWASALGSDVTVSAPAPAAPGNGSPAAAVAGVFAAVSSKQFSQECAYVEPSVQSACKSGAPAISSSSAPSLKNAGIGYVAVHGNEALVGTTGTFCVPGESPQCYTNNDPASLFSTKKSFATLWSEAINTGSANAYSLAPCIEINGKWYLHESS